MPTPTLPPDVPRGAIRRGFAAALVLAVAACAPKPGADADDYAVWSAAIGALVSPAAGPISVHSHTSFDELRVSPTVLSIWMQHDYDQRNRVRAAIDPARLSVSGVRLLRDDSASVAARRDTGAIFHEPWIALTRPGYSLNHGTAVVRITSSCGDLCGGGEAMVLVRGDDGRWRKEATIEVVEY